MARVSVTVKAVVAMAAVVALTSSNGATALSLRGGVQTVGDARQDIEEEIRRVREYVQEQEKKVQEFTAQLEDEGQDEAEEAQEELQKVTEYAAEKGEAAKQYLQEQAQVVADALADPTNIDVDAAKKWAEKQVDAILKFVKGIEADAESEQEAIRKAVEAQAKTARAEGEQMKQFIQDQQEALQQEAQRVIEWVKKELGGDANAVELANLPDDVKAEIERIKKYVEDEAQEAESLVKDVEDAAEKDAEAFEKEGEAIADDARKIGETAVSWAGDAIKQLRDILENDPSVDKIRGFMEDKAAEAKAFVEKDVVQAAQEEVKHLSDLVSKDAEQTKELRAKIRQFVDENVEAARNELQRIAKYIMDKISGGGDEARPMLVNAHGPLKLRAPLLHSPRDDIKAEFERIQKYISEQEKEAEDFINNKVISDAEEDTEEIDEEVERIKEYAAAKAETVQDYLAEQQKVIADALQDPLSIDLDEAKKYVAEQMQTIRKFVASVQEDATKEEGAVSKVVEKKAQEARELGQDVAAFLRKNAEATQDEAERVVEWIKEQFSSSSSNGNVGDIPDDVKAEIEKIKEWAQDQAKTAEELAADAEAAAESDAESWEKEGERIVNDSRALTDKAVSWARATFNELKDVLANGPSVDEIRSFMEKKAGEAQDFIQNDVAEAAKSEASRLSDLVSKETEDTKDLRAKIQDFVAGNVKAAQAELKKIVEYIKEHITGGAKVGAIRLALA